MNIANNKHQTVTQSKLPTIRQLERDIYQQFSQIYKSKVGYSPYKVDCSIFQSYLVLVAEEALSPLELNLKKSGKSEILLEIRQNVDKILAGELKKIIEERAEIKVIDLVCSLNINSDRLMAMAILAEYPHVRIRKKAQVPQTP